jgi:hypothetical protein
MSRVTEAVATRWTRRATTYVRSKHLLSAGQPGLPIPEIALRREMAARVGRVADATESV